MAENFEQLQTEDDAQGQAVEGAEDEAEGRCEVDLFENFDRFLLVRVFVIPLWKTHANTTRNEDRFNCNFFLLWLRPIMFL